MYQIKEVSKIVQIPESKIRYYEKEGIFPPFNRDKNNIRIFSDKDIELINLVKCLRNIGMPMKEIRENVALLLDKNKDLTARDILIEHRDKLEEQRNLLKRYIDEINSKLDDNVNV